MKKERRWMKAIIAASTTDMPAMPWQRGNRRKPVAVKAVAVKSVRVAAR